ncbi:MAG: hypothetical protein NT007_11855 [Candidatus Kapabacteria bacterium]|nr:hypothetical protein [Candidatus Kapabacteria bacterium]
MSFLRMQKSPASATLGDSCIRRNDRNEAFEIVSLMINIISQMKSENYSIKY